MPSKSPEQWLEATSSKKEALLKLFLGYAPGVGKTYSMLSEAIRRHSRSEDVVVGVIETHGRKPVVELTAKLPAVPRCRLEYKGAIFEEMDVDAIIGRKPQVAVVDELAHTNVEGSKHAKRYQDVIDVLDAGIDVLTTMNVQHIESMTPIVRSITGVTVRELVPDWVMHRVNEIVLVDLTPEALRHRMERGDIYPVERAERALAHFFQAGNLIALRELALRQVTQVVDRSLESYLGSEHIDQPGVHERIAVCISSNPAAQSLIARGWRMAQAVKADFLVVYVDTGVDDNPEDQRTLGRNLEFAQNLRAEIVKLTGPDVAETVAKYVREKHVTQVVFGHSATSGWRRFLYMSAVHRFLRDAPCVDVHIVTQTR